MIGYIISLLMNNIPIMEYNNLVNKIIFLLLRRIYGEGVEYT